LVLLPSWTNCEVEAAKPGRSISQVSSQTETGRQAPQTSGPSTTTSRSTQSTPVPIDPSRLASQNPAVGPTFSAAGLSGAGAASFAEANSPPMVSESAHLAAVQPLSVSRENAFDGSKRPAIPSSTLS
jgi:hypothetical protein